MSFWRLVGLDREMTPRGPARGMRVKEINACEMSEDFAEAGFGSSTLGGGVRSANFKRYPLSAFHGIMERLSNGIDRSAGAAVPHSGERLP